MADQFDVGAIPPGLSGIMIDERFDQRDLTATILDLARRGYMKIEEINKRRRRTS